MEASGGKEAPASLLLSLNGVGDSDGSVAENSNMITGTISTPFCILSKFVQHLFKKSSFDEDLLAITI